MEAYFSILYEDVRRHRSLILLQFLTDSELLKQSKFFDPEMSIMQNLALEKLRRQKCLNYNFALQSKE